MSVFVIAPDFNQGNDIDQVFKAAALETKGTENYIDYMEEYGGIDRTASEVTYGIHASLFRDVVIDKVYKLSLSFSDAQKQALIKAGAVVQDNAPEGYRAAKIFKPQP
ncbi:MAG TPA: hypothetical protein VIF12_02115 [Micavibrio sp.]|jgi:hypothetical protein